MSPAEQKIRETIEANPQLFETEGPNVVRWLSSGGLPHAFVTFHPFEHIPIIAVRCAACGAHLGVFDKNYGPDTFRHLSNIHAKYLTHTHSRPFIRTNIHPKFRDLSSL